MRTQRVTIVDTYEGPSKTRVLVAREQITAMAIDAQARACEAHDLYEQLNLTNGKKGTPTSSSTPKLHTTTSLSRTTTKTTRPAKAASST